MEGIAINRNGNALSERASDSPFLESTDNFAESGEVIDLRSWSAQDFSNIYVRFRPLLLTQAQRLLHDAASAEEVVHDAFLYLMTALPELDSEIGVLKFLRWKTRLLAIDVLRLRRRYDEVDLEESHQIINSSPEVTEELERAEDSAIVALALAKLPIRQREAIVATIYEEKSISEVSQQMGLSENAFRQLLFRSKSSFKQALVGEADVAGLRVSEILSLAAKKTFDRARHNATRLGVGIMLVVLSTASWVTVAPDQSSDLVSLAVRSEIPNMGLAKPPIVIAPDIQGNRVDEGRPEAEVHDEVSSLIRKPLNDTLSLGPVSALAADQIVSKSTRDVIGVSELPAPESFIEEASIDEDSLLREMLAEEIGEVGFGNPRHGQPTTVVDQLQELTLEVIPGVELHLGFHEVSGSQKLSFAMLRIISGSGLDVVGVPKSSLLVQESSSGGETLSLGLTDFVFGDFSGSYGNVAVSPPQIAGLGLVVNGSRSLAIEPSEWDFTVELRGISVS